MLFAIEMEDTSDQIRPERTIMTPKHLKSSAWKYFVQSSCLSLLYSDNKSADSPSTSLTHTHKHTHTHTKPAVFERSAQTEFDHRTFWDAQPVSAP